MKEEVKSFLKTHINIHATCLNYIFIGSNRLFAYDCAKYFAMGLNCIQGITTNPCENCFNCLQILGGNCLDFIFLGETDPDHQMYCMWDVSESREFGIDYVRQIIQFVYQSPHYLKKKFFLIEHDRLTINAQNALLKVLEERYGDCIFILLSSNSSKILPTIQSRCQTIYSTVSNDESKQDAFLHKDMIQDIINAIHVKDHKEMRMVITWRERILEDDEKISLKEKAERFLDNFLCQCHSSFETLHPLLMYRIEAIFDAYQYLIRNVSPAIVLDAFLSSILFGRKLYL